MENKYSDSKNYKDDRFVNSTPTNIGVPGKFWETVLKWIFSGDKERVPASPLPVRKLKNSDFKKEASEKIKFVWLGHSTVLIEMEGNRFLFDPVFSQRASLVQWAGPERFHPVPIEIDELPVLDGVIISHNHYDHLDKSTIQVLAKRNLDFFVPLGVGDYLEKWGVKRSKIFEFDWQDSKKIKDMTIISTPARHFSGRGLFDNGKTLWCSWTLVGKKYRIHFSGDTGFTPEFNDIGSMHGPFDLTFIKIGAYDTLWPDIHLNPEEAVQAHQNLKGKMLVPIHWGTFNLGLHSWHEPPERLARSAAEEKVKFIIPGIGEIVDPEKCRNTFWWRKEVKK